MGTGVGGSGSRWGPEFVHNRSGEAVLQPAAPAASATTSAPAGPRLAACRLIGANRSGLLVGFVFVGFAFIRNGAGNRGRVRHNARNLVLVTREPAFADLAGTAATPTPTLALVAIRLRFAATTRADRRFVGQPFGLFGFQFRFDFDVDRLFLFQLPFRSLRPRSPPHPP